MRLVRAKESRALGAPGAEPLDCCFGSRGDRAHHPHSCQRMMAEENIKQKRHGVPRTLTDADKAQLGLWAVARLLKETHHMHSPHTS